MTKKFSFELTSTALHIIAMLSMLCDHLWGTVVPGNDWMTCVGRIAFPIFAFMIVEGYFHTKNLRKYVGRLTLFAIISEIPFNLIISGSFINPFQQNVMWTFLIAIGLIWLNERVNHRKLWLKILVMISTLFLGVVLGVLAMSDYGYGGVMTVLVFYFFRERKWWCYLAQIVCMIYLNTEVMGGYGTDLNIFGIEFFFHRQSFAVLSLIPIWLYKGEQGYHSKWLKYFNYSFYPAHMLIIGLIAYFL